MTPVTQLRRILRATVLWGAAVLALFHVALFGEQLLEGRLASLDLAVRWIVAGGLIGVLFVLRRQGERLASRKGVASWILIALLHGPAVADEASPWLLPGLPDVAVRTLQLATAATAVGLVMVAAVARACQQPAAVFVGRRAARASDPRHRRPSPTYSPRPPPSIP